MIFFRIARLSYICFSGRRMVTKRRWQLCENKMTNRPLRRGYNYDDIVWDFLSTVVMINNRKPWRQRGRLRLKLTVIGATWQVRCKLFMAGVSVKNIWKVYLGVSDWCSLWCGRCSRLMWLVNWGKAVFFLVSIYSEWESRVRAVLLVFLNWTYHVFI